MRKLLIAGGLVALVALVVVGLSQTSTKNEAPREDALRFTPAQIEQELAGAPAPLAALHAQGNQLLPGELKAVRERLDELKGTPVVINKWASWCGPCRAEFPAFQNVSVTLGKRVAFLGLNSGDNSGDAKDFLADFPLSFPSYEDPKSKVAQDLGVPVNFPATFFFDASGEKVFTHQGPYTKEADLIADIEKYAFGS